MATVHADLDARAPVTVQVTSEADPTHRASVGFVLIVESGSGLDMDVRPAEASGRDATFQIAFLNQWPATAAWPDGGSQSKGRWTGNCNTVSAP